MSCSSNVFLNNGGTVLTWQVRQPLLEARVASPGEVSRRVESVVALGSGCQNSMEIPKASWDL